MPKPKKCIQCGEPIKYQFTTTQKVCSINCQLEFNRENPKEVKSFIQSLAEKEAKKEAKEWKQKKKVLKEKLKSLSELEKDAKKVFQKWIRLRDQGKPCISCGCRLTNTNTHASHYFAAGIYSGYMFSEENCHSSCVQCNTFLHGNLLGYRSGLIKRYGVTYVDDLEAGSSARRNHKYTKSELVEIKNTYNQKLKEIERIK